MYEIRHNDNVFFAGLCDALQCEYGLNILRITPAQRGYYGETWILDTEYKKYFIKIVYSPNHQRVFAENLCVVSFLQSNGINYISSVVKNTAGENSILFCGGRLALFEFIPGKLTKEYPKEMLYQCLSKIYLVSPEGLKIEKEDFSTACVSYVIGNINLLDELVAHRDMLLRYADRLLGLATLCRKDFSNFFITHGDSGSNVIEYQKHIYIIDWDTPKLAAPERDAWMFIHGFPDIEIFNSTLLNAGIKYSLQKERLAFYCYYSYFYYLQEHLFQFQNAKDDISKRRIKGFIRHFFLRGWIIQQVDLIEKIYHGYC